MSDEPNPITINFTAWVTLPSGAIVMIGCQSFADGQEAAKLLTRAGATVTWDFPGAMAAEVKPAGGSLKEGEVV